MANLIPFEEYARSDRAHWASVRLRIGLLFGICMGGFSFAMGHTGLMGSALIAVFAGTLFGVLWVALMQMSMRRLLKRIYDADPTLVGPEPSPDEYGFRMPCSLLRAPLMAVGGVLHMGRTEWRFVPHRRNLPKHRDPLTIRPLDDLELALVPTQLSRLSKLLVSKAPDVVELRWGSETARLLVPTPETTLRLLRNVRAGAA
jgi:hypothetical protein